MKKFFVVAIALVMTMSLTACGAGLMGLMGSDPISAEPISADTEIISVDRIN